MANFSLKEMKSGLNKANIDYTDKSEVEVETMFRAHLADNSKFNSNRAFELFRRQIRDGDFNSLVVKKGDRFGIIPAST